MLKRWKGSSREYFGVKEGVLVRAVAKNSAAERAGIKAGDVITRVDDAKIASAGRYFQPHPIDARQIGSHGVAARSQGSDSQRRGGRRRPVRLVA